METKSPPLRAGFYWVKVEDGPGGDTPHWEPAYYFGEKSDEWGLCGSDPFLNTEHLLEIGKPLVYVGD